jgi:hypothetical protein
VPSVAAKLQSLLDPVFHVWTSLHLYMHSWSDTQITAYTVNSQDTIDLTLTSQGYYGQNVDEIVATYMNTFPTISALNGQLAGYATVGGQIISMNVTGLDGPTTGVRVYVGGQTCALTDPAGDNIQTDAQSMQYIVHAQARALAFKFGRVR